ncbi:hypothetical protein LCGC14_0479410 [marine sediment metagenome]|uniref:Uncharacterized protein n=1 Tax=marine sediment metagenome TaxID=412755 RepID=A0A0F9S9Q3_9ZZZZ
MEFATNITEEEDRPMSMCILAELFFYCREGKRIS